MTGLEARNTTLGYMQRGGTPTALIEFYQQNMEQRQWNLLLEGKFGTLAIMEKMESWILYL